MGPGDRKANTSAIEPSLWASAIRDNGVSKTGAIMKAALAPMK
ncbi:MAG: hypothetical protein U5O39_02755 [Gammaproteobacteria bacterium]|nr:hypothetical protein [Gammaproteobacteria bacterium]